MKKIAVILMVTSFYAVVAHAAIKVTNSNCSPKITIKLATFLGAKGSCVDTQTVSINSTKAVEFKDAKDGCRYVVTSRADTANSIEARSNQNNPFRNHDQVMCSYQKAHDYCFCQINKR